MLRRSLLKNQIGGGGEGTPQFNESNFIVCTFNCSSKYQNVKILGDKFNKTLIRYIYINENKKPVTLTSNLYTFQKAGTYKIKYIFKDLFNTSISFMFDRCEELAAFDFSHFIMSSLIEMKFVFYKTGITNVELTGYDWSNLTTMEGMFQNCVNSTSIKILNCKTPKLTNIAFLCDYSNFKSADFSGLDTTNVTTMEAMFRNNWYLDTLKLMYPIDKVTNTKQIFNGIIGLKLYHNKNYNYDKLPTTLFGKKIPV